MQAQVFPTAPAGMQTPEDAPTMPAYPSSTDPGEEHVESPGKTKAVLSKVKHKAKKLKDKFKKVTSSNIPANTHVHGDLQSEQMRGQGEHVYPPRTNDEQHDVEGETEMYDDDDAYDNEEEEHILLGDDQSKYEQMRSLRPLHKLGDGSEVEVHGGIPASALAPTPGPYLKPIDENAHSSFESSGPSDALQKMMMDDDSSAINGLHMKSVESKSPISPFRSAGPPDSLQAAPTQYHYGAINDTPGYEMNSKNADVNADPYNSEARTVQHDHAVKNGLLLEGLRPTVDQARTSPFDASYTSPDKISRGSNLQLLDQEGLPTSTETKRSCLSPDLSKGSNLQLLDQEGLPISTETKQSYLSPDLSKGRNLQLLDQEGLPISTQTKRSYLSPDPPTADILSHREPASSESPTQNDINVAYPHDIAKPNPEFGHSESPMHDKIAVINEDLPAEMKLDSGLAFDDFANQHSLMETSVPENTPICFEGDEPVERPGPGMSITPFDEMVTPTGVGTAGQSFDNVGKDYKTGVPFMGSSDSELYSEDPSKNVISGGTSFVHKASESINDSEPVKDNANDLNPKVSDEVIRGPSQPTPFGQSALYDDVDGREQSPLSQDVPSSGQDVLSDGTRGKSPLIQNASDDDARGQSQFSQYQGEETNDQESWGKWSADKLHNVKNAAVVTTSLLVSGERDANEQPIIGDISDARRGSADSKQQESGNVDLERQGLGDASREYEEPTQPESITDSIDIVSNDATRVAPDAGSVLSVGDDKVNDKHVGQVNTGLDSGISGLVKTGSDVDYYDPNNVDGNQFREGFALGSGDSEEEALNGTLAGSAIGKLQGLRETVATKLGLTGNVNSDNLHVDNSDEHNEASRSAEDVQRSQVESEELEDASGQQTGVIQGLKNTAASALGYGEASFLKPSYSYGDDHEHQATPSGHQSEHVQQQKGGALNGLKNTLASKLGYGSLEPRSESTVQTGVWQSAKNIDPLKDGFGASEELQNDQAVYDDAKDHANELHKREVDQPPKEELVESTPPSEQKAGGALQGLKNVVAADLGYGNPLQFPADHRKEVMGDGSHDEVVNRKTHFADEPEGRRTSNAEVGSPPIQQRGTGGALQGLKNVVASTLGYGTTPSTPGAEDVKDGRGDHSYNNEGSAVDQPTSYTQKLLGTAAAAKDYLSSKAGYGNVDNEGEVKNRSKSYGDGPTVTM